MKRGELAGRKQCFRQDENRISRVDGIKIQARKSAASQRLHSQHIHYCIYVGDRAVLRNSRRSIHAPPTASRMAGIHRADGYLCRSATVVSKPNEGFPGWENNLFVASLMVRCQIHDMVHVPIPQGTVHFRTSKSTRPSSSTVTSSAANTCIYQQ